MTQYELYGGEVILKFDEGKHLYSVAGKNVASVTGVTKIIDKSGPLMWWAVGQAIDHIDRYCQDNDYTEAAFDEVSWKTMLHDAQRAYMGSSGKAATIGTLVHKWIEDWLGGGAPELPKNPQMKRSVQSFLEWQRDAGLTPIETEFKVYSREHNYAGTCDVDGMINGERAIADWKTGKAVYPEFPVQLMGYKIAREEESGTRYDAMYAVVLPKDGGDVIVKRYGPEDFELYESAFLGALNLMRAIKRKVK